MQRTDMFDKVLLFLIGLTMYGLFSRNNMEVVPAIISVIAIGLATYFENSKLNITILIIYLVLGYLIPPLLYFMPALLYTVYEKEYSYLILFAYLPFCFETTYKADLLVFIFFFGILAVWQKYRMIDLYRLKKTHYELQDNKRKLERDSDLQRKILLEKQDEETLSATLNERNRIAREIHDNVGHQLSSAILQLGALRIADSESKPLITLEKTLNLAMDNIRQSVHNLYDTSIDLYLQLKMLTENFKFCEIILEYNVEETYNSQIKYAIIAIVKEALSNIIKHSNATKVDVSMIEHPAFYQLIIYDNGSKLCIGDTDGIGLKNIAHRIDNLGGQFRVKTNKGYEIFITIPKGESR